ncbi:hypothetical protein C0J52_25475 [Blattella germanica]|nr:hypothetical protein C0J52_25475 [Blattella germanica]
MPKWVTEADDYECPLPPETQEIARKELRETKYARDQALQQMRDWIKKHPRIANCRLGMPHRRERAQYQQVSPFERGRLIGLREAGLSYRDIAARTGHAATTVMRVWNEQRRADIVPRNVTTARDDRHLVRMAVTDRTDSSTVLSRRWNTATGLGMSASTVRLLRAGLVARMPLRRFPLSRDHQRLKLQWVRERRHWRAEWQNVVFSDESRFNMSYNDGRIRVRRYGGERNLRACILQRHKGPTPSVMVWGVIEYHMRSHACFLLRFLRVKKFHVPQAQEALERYLLLRQAYAEAFHGLDHTDPVMDELISNG